MSIQGSIVVKVTDEIGRGQGHARGPIVVWVTDEVTLAVDVNRSPRCARVYDLGVSGRRSVVIKVSVVIEVLFTLEFMVVQSSSLKPHSEYCSSPCFISIPVPNSHLTSNLAMTLACPYI